MRDLVIDWSERIRAAAAAKVPLRVHGGATKDFYGATLAGEPFDTSGHRGIVQYEPTELVVTARCGTPLAELQATLREHGQMLAFEPPCFGERATLGGCIAAGLSGPRRAAAGSVRDFVLGVRMLDGRGDELAFGGQVMKNVAGYDVSRLITGSLGTLGVILDVSMKVLPVPAAEITLCFEMPAARAVERVNAWAGQPWPVTATCHESALLTVRLSGAQAAIRAARAQLGGEEMPQAEAFWEALREQRAAFFAGDEPLWRLSVRSTAAPLALADAELAEWNGAQRWIRTRARADQVRAAAHAAGGHATVFRARDKSDGVFHPLPPVLMELHRRLKRQFDPAGIFNRGRMYRDLDD